MFEFWEFICGSEETIAIVFLLHEVIVKDMVLVFLEIGFRAPFPGKRSPERLKPSRTTSSASCGAIVVVCSALLVASSNKELGLLAGTFLFGLGVLEVALQVAG